MSDTTDPIAEPIGIIIVDHGSRRRESNDMLLDVIRHFQTVHGHRIVEPAHMELAEPTVGQAFDRCVEQGAKTVVVHPYFLLPGRHWSQDIPRLAAEAAARHSQIHYLVTAPLSLHPLMSDVIQARIDQCLRHAAGDGEPCEVCAAGNETNPCSIRDNQRANEP